MAGVEYFDEEALAVATLAAGSPGYGIEPRHLRLYKNAADREAGFVEQIVLPLVRQRNPEARAGPARRPTSWPGSASSSARPPCSAGALRDLLGRLSSPAGRPPGGAGA